MMYTVRMTTDTTTEEPDLTKLEKIRALLDKAESTAAEFPQEAESLTAKAVELMVRYRIDEAMLQDSKPLQDRGEIVEVTFPIGSGPYVNARLLLAGEIARNHSVKLLQSTGWKGKQVHLIGYETDVALTEMLYTSLFLQATRAMSSKEVKLSKPGYVHGTAFCRSFLIGFAAKIGERLDRANANATDPIWTPNDTEVSGRSVAMVLADRKADVEADVFRRYGRIRTARSQGTASSSWAGSHAGAAAADKADLSTNRRVGGSRRELT